MLTRGKSKRSYTGAKNTFYRKKKKFRVAGELLLTKMDPFRKKLMQARGGNVKQRLMATDKANVLDPSSGKSKVVSIKTVSGNPANLQYVKRNIMNKSAIIETELGKARVTSRPGQDGIVNAVLIKE